MVLNLHYFLNKGRSKIALITIHTAMAAVKCGKIMEVTPGTPDVKSRPMRYWKGLQLQLMCCAPFRLLSQDFRTRKTEYQRLEYWSKCLELFSE